MKNKLIKKLSLIALRSGLALSSFTGKLSVKGGRSLITPLVSMVRLVAGCMTKSYVKVVRQFIVRVSLLVKNQGVRGACLYLKAASVLFQQSIGGSILHDAGRLGPRVGRRGTGLPSIIPDQMRKRIRGGDKVAIRVWFTLLSIYRVLEFPGRVKLSTITEPGLDISSMRGDVYRAAYAIGGPMTALRIDEMEVKPRAIPKSSGTTDAELVYGIDAKRKVVATMQSTALASLVSAAKALQSSTLVWEACLHWARYTINGPAWAESVSAFAKVPGVEPGKIGKLGLKAEAAGKVRVFAMVDA